MLQTTVYVVNAMQKMGRDPATCRIYKHPLAILAPVKLQLDRILAWSFLG